MAANVPLFQFGPDCADQLAGGSGGGLFQGGNQPDSAPSGHLSTQYTSGSVQSTPALLADYVGHFVSTLLLMPGHPKKGPFYLMEELLRALEEWPLWAKDKVTVEKATAYLSIFKIFCTFSQRKFPYSIKGLSSNDDLYGRNGQYLEHCIKIVNRFGKHIHRQLNELKSSQRQLDRLAAGLLALKFINILVDDVVSDGKSMKIVVVVHRIVLDAKNVDQKFYRNTMDHIRSRNEVLYSALKKQEKENE